MTELVARFERFFAAVNSGRSPYPWQCELVMEIGETGRWPRAIAMPTGAGKSSVVDVHVFLVAERARTRERLEDAGLQIARPPRRLVLVAPRRVLVEDQFERARELAHLLAKAQRGAASDPIVSEVATALAAMRTSAEETEDIHGGEDAHGAAEYGESPLGVARLRGGVRLDLGWRLDPAQCQVICSTPQMWGSRLLLRGFRASRRSRNLEAGLLGHDVAVVIDEAHLHERLVATATRVAADNNGPLGLQIVAMSATRPASDARTLKDEDLVDDGLRRRVCATKRIRVVEVDEWRRNASATLASEAAALSDRGTVGVFVNTVRMALDVADRLDGTVVVVCGRMRPADLDQVRGRFPGLLDARGNNDVDYLVTTQSLEVGVDLDLPALVSEIAPPAALAQRAGRLNRSGRYDDAPLVIVAPSNLDQTDPKALASQFGPYEPDEIISAHGWIKRLGGDASPNRITATPLPIPQRLPLPPLTRPELETFAIASHDLAADADPSFYVEEPRDQADRSVSIAARDRLDEPENVVRQMLLAAPPRAHELASLPMGRELDAVLKAAPGAWVIRSDNGQLRADPIDDGCDPRSGDVIVIPDGSQVCTRGVIGLAGRRTGSPIGDVTAERPDGPPDVIIPLETADLRDLLENDPTLGTRRARRGLAEVVEASGQPAAAKWLRRWRLSDLEVTWCGEEGEDRGVLAIVPTERAGRLPQASVTTDGQLVSIDAHRSSVERRMEAVLAALDIDPARDLGVAREQLRLAARWHDEGKHHPRFQARMGADPDGPPLAKPAPGRRADRGDGWRHEQLSAGFAWAYSERDPVVTVIVTGHHGAGLGLFDRDAKALLDGWESCNPSVLDALDELFGPCGRYELERARLTRSLGLHRLCYLEALLRCADMQVSREGG